MSNNAIISPTTLLSKEGSKTFPAVHKLVFRDQLLNYLAFYVSGNIHLMFGKSLFSQVAFLHIQFQVFLYKFQESK